MQRADRIRRLFIELGEVRKNEAGILGELEQLLTEPDGTLFGALGPATSPVVVLEFDAAGAPSSWGLTAAQVKDWEAAYPSVDILPECRKAGAWLAANGKKTARGMPKFLNRWLAKAQDDWRRNGPPRSGPWPGPGLRAIGNGHKPYQGGTVGDWVCPHVEGCGNPTACRLAFGLSRPVKPNIRYTLDAHGVPRQPD